jgi:hypothetical protein
MAQPPHWLWCTGANQQFEHDMQLNILKEENVMKRIAFVLVFVLLFVALAVILSACAGVPQHPQIPQIAGDERVTQPGFSFVVPANKSWSVLVQSTYQISLGAWGDNPNETLVVFANTFQVPASSSPQDFLAYIKSWRAAEPQTGRFEVVRNDEQLYTERSETCVKHEAEYKDFGVGAKRGGDYSVIQYVGMNCIHPNQPTVGILVELSRKAPPGIEYPQFKTMGSQLLKSVEFSAYR